MINVSVRKILTIALQLIILIGCVAYLYFVYYADIYPNQHLKETYEQTTCKIDDAKLVTTGQWLQRYRVDFLVTYTAQSAPYTRVPTTSGGLNSTFSTDETTQRALLQQFVVGSSYPCWYHPSNPRLVVLKIKQHVSSSFPWFVPVTIAIVMIYFLIISLIKLIVLLYTHFKKSSCQLKK